MLKYLFHFLAGALLFSFTLACNSVGIYQPEATEAAVQGTLSALQGTIAALQTSDTITQTQSATQIIVVTATPTMTATPSTTPTAKPTATVITAAPSPSSTPSKAIANSSQGETIPLTTSTLTSTPTATPASEAYLDAPRIVEPEEGIVIEQGRPVTLRWTWTGSLGSDEHFDIKIKTDGQDSSAYIAWEEVEAHEFTADLTPGRYYWSVQVIKGHYKSDRRTPEDRVFEAFLGPESEPRLIIIEKKEPKSPRSVSQADPPASSMHYGLLLGGLAFAALARWTRLKNM